MLPNLITHYFPLQDGPFRNLCDLEEDAATSVIKSLAKRRADDPRFKRIFGRRYMEFRRRTEAKLHAKFVQSGGRPERKSPHYFVLGTCEWFRDLYPETGSVSLEFRDLPSDVVSFTYPDSFVSMRLGAEYGLPEEPLEPYHDKVFRAERLGVIVETYGMPDGRADTEYDGYQNRSFEKYLEFQIWSDAPVAQFLTRL